MEEEVMSKTPWIITYEKDLGWKCLRCGHATALQLPVQISVWLAAAKAFAAAHRHCREAK